MNFITLAIVLINSIAILFGIGMTFYYLSASSIIGLAFILLGAKNIYYIVLSRPLVKEFYNSTERLTGVPDHNTYPQNVSLRKELLQIRNFPAMITLAFVGFLEASILIFIPFLIICRALLGVQGLVKPALISIVFIVYGFCMCRYVYLNFKAMRILYQRHKLKKELV